MLCCGIKYWRLRARIKRVYLPPHFEETDTQRIRDLVENHPLATLVAHTASGLVANHLPVLWADDDTLIGHIALANNLHQRIADDAEVLAIFHGPDAYVSPNWYPSKRVHQRHVPTWNYSTVHIHGRLTFSHDEATKRSVVAKLTRHHEQLRHGDEAWRMSDAPRDYMDSMLAGIVALRIRVSRVSAKFKLSQNREANDLEGAAAALEAAGHGDIAAEMRRK